MTRLESGNTAPDFTLDAADGTSFSLHELRGSRVILYFYPKAMTGGCTKQACDFRDNLQSLETDGYRVVGVSRDNIEKLQRFAERDGLTFPLLSDPEHVVHELYGAWGEKNSYGRTVVGVLRSTFVIDADGTITHTFYNTKATGHVSMLRKRLGLAATGA